MPELFVQRTADQRVLRQLAQARPNATAAASIYTPGDGVQGSVKQVIICNTTGSEALFDLFHDDDGTTYDESTQLWKESTVAPNSTRTLGQDLFVDSPGNVAVATDTSLALTFTFYGDEVQVRAR